MNEGASRNAVVAGIRRAVAPWAAEMPQAFTWPAPSLTPGALVDRFVAAAQAAQASVFVASDFAGALREVGRILAERDARGVVVSEDAWGRPWDVGQLSAVIERGAVADAAGAPAGVTTAGYGMADTGTIVVCSGPAGGRVESLLPPVHIGLLRASRLVAGLPDLLALLGRERFEQSSAVTFITGPSRTADIELTLTIGVHGPKELFIVVVDDIHGR